MSAGQQQALPHRRSAVLLAHRLRLVVGGIEDPAAVETGTEPDEFTATVLGVIADGRRSVMSRRCMWPQITRREKPSRSR